MSTTEETVTVQRRGAALWLRLNRPQALNSISPQMIRELNQALDEHAHDRDVRAIVITGAGRAFCCGGDLKAVSELAAGDDVATATAAFLQSISALLSRIERLPVPVIAAINGLALAGGLEIAVSCDIVVAAESARFGDVHANYGLLPGGGGSVRLPRKIGTNRAKYLMLTGRQVDARDMQAWGLVAQLCEDEQLEACVDALVAELATKSPVGLQRMKSLVDDTMEQPIEQALRHEQAVCAAHNDSYDRNEGLAAFAERRTPRFLGH